MKSLYDQEMFGLEEEAKDLSVGCVVKRFDTVEDILRKKKKESEHTDRAIVIGKIIIEMSTNVMMFTRCTGLDFELHILLVPSSSKKLSIAYEICTTFL